MAGMQTVLKASLTESPLEAAVVVRPARRALGRQAKRALAIAAFVAAAICGSVLSLANFRYLESLSPTVQESGSGVVAAHGAQQH